MSVEGVTPEQVLEIEQPDIEVLWAERHTHKLRVGHLRGNRFELTLYDIPHDTLPQVKTVMERLVTEGVPNRFGAQRFGNKNDSHLIGKALVKAEWETVLHYMLTADDTASGRCRAAYAAGINTETCRKSDHFYSASVAQVISVGVSSASLQQHLGETDAAFRQASLKATLPLNIATVPPFLFRTQRLNNGVQIRLRLVLRDRSSGTRCGCRLATYCTLETSLLADEGVRFEQFCKVVGSSVTGNT